jgi:hypothetical protein
LKACDWGKHGTEEEDQLDAEDRNLRPVQALSCDVREDKEVYRYMP